MSEPPPWFNRGQEEGQDVGEGGLLLELSNEHCSGAVWPAAHALLDFLSDSTRGGDGTVLPRRGSTVLELGAGTGWMALKMKPVLEREDLTRCATEMAGYGAAERLARNVAAGTTDEEGRGRIRSQQLDWEDAVRRCKLTSA